MNISTNYNSLLSAIPTGISDHLQDITAKVSAAGLPHLNYYGGKILTDPKFYSLFLGAFWKSKRGSAEVAYHESAAKSLFNSQHMELWREYGVNRGKFIGSSTVGVHTHPKVIDESTIQSRIWSEIKAGRAPKPDGSTVYTLYLPPGTILRSSDGDSSLNGLGGYHGSFDMPDGKPAYYAALAYSDSKNGIAFTNSPKQNVTITASHEWTEAVTDPDVTAGELGWYDEGYGEVGDIPINLGLPLKEVYGTIDGFKVQKEWSNSKGKSVL